MAITAVMVKATTASMLICCEMLSQLRPVMNVSGRLNQKKMRTARMPIRVPYRLSAAGMFVFHQCVTVAEVEESARGQSSRGNNRHDGTQAEHGNTVGHPQEFVQVG